MFNNKTLLITGGTGSFGKAVLDRFLDSSLSEIRVFSRDEKKQDDLRKQYSSSKLKFYLGDVRDYAAVNNAMKGSNYVFHAAALKQVPSCEFYPMEAIKTNVIGTDNVIEAAMANCVEKAVFLSTDKAVYPINAMGISKAMMEKVVIAKSRSSNKTMSCITRYGNVMSSRGSVIPLFAKQLSENRTLTITDPNMTRFMMTLDEAVNLVIYAFENASSGDIFVQKSPAASIKTLVDAMKEIYYSSKSSIEIIGTRHGEKLYEVLLSREELVRSQDLGIYFRVQPDLRELNYDKFVDKGEEDISVSEDYNSHNTNQLSISELKSLLVSLNGIG